MKDDDGDAGSVVVEPMDVTQVDTEVQYSAAEIESQVFDPNASVYLSEAMNETVSDSLEEPRLSQWSISADSRSRQARQSRMDVQEEHGGELNHAVGPLRALLANKEYVTQPQLSSLLRTIGYETREDVTETMVQELQAMGILGALARGKGTLEVDSRRGTGCLAVVDCRVPLLPVPQHPPHVRPGVRFCNASRSARYFFAPPLNVFLLKSDRRTDPPRATLKWCSASRNASLSCL